MTDVAALHTALASLGAERVVRALGLTRMERDGQGVRIPCVVHDGTDYNLAVAERRGRIVYRCFVCGSSGDVFGLIAAARSMDVRDNFAEVVSVAAELASMPVSSAQHRGPARQQAQRLDPETYSEVVASLIARCPFTEARAVLAYLDARRLIVVAAGATLGGLPARNEQASVVAELIAVFGADALERAGLLWPGERRHFADPDHVLLIPWRASDGTVAVLQRRRVDGEKRQKYKFPRGYSVPAPYGVERLALVTDQTEIMIVEGAVDALALRLVAWRDRDDILPLGIPGVDGWRSEWARCASGRSVLIGLDADAAGDRKVRAIADDFYAAGAASVRRARPAKAKDWADALVWGDL